MCVFSFFSDDNKGVERARATLPSLVAHVPFRSYPWCLAIACLERAAMLLVWKLGSRSEPGLKSVTIRILHLWVRQCGRGRRSCRFAAPYRAVICEKWRRETVDFGARYFGGVAAPLLPPLLSCTVVPLFLSRHLGPFVSSRRTCSLAHSRLSRYRFKGCLIFGFVSLRRVLRRGFVVFSPPCISSTFVERKGGSQAVCY